MLPGVSWSAPLPFPLWVPEQGISCDTRGRFTKCMANPSPASMEDFFLYRVLSGFLPQFQVADFVRPTDSEDSSKACVYESLDSLHGADCCSPGFRSI